MKNWDLSLLSDELREIIGKADFKQITIGESGAYTYLLTEDNMPNRYLKISPKSLNLGTDREVGLLRWLYGKLPVPEVLFFGTDSEYEYLLMTEIKGDWSFDSPLNDDMPRLIRVLAKGLRMIHSVDISDCPIDLSLDIKLKDAGFRVTGGLVDENDFNEAYLGKKAGDLFEELINTRPAKEDLVFTHGDYCLPNVLIYNGDLGGFIDWGRGGIADRYQDLALAARSLAYNFDEKWVPLLFKEYGIDTIDYAKIEYYKKLDELF